MKRSIVRALASVGFVAVTVAAATGVGGCGLGGEGFPGIGPETSSTLPSADAGAHRDVDAGSNGNGAGANGNGAGANGNDAGSNGNGDGPNGAGGNGNDAGGNGSGGAADAGGNATDADGGTTDASPSAGGDGGAMTSDAAADDPFVAHALARLNALRADDGVAPLALDGTLSDFAALASAALAASHVPHGRFDDAIAAGDLPSWGFAHGSSESQGDPYGEPTVDGAADPSATAEATEMAQIDATIDAFVAEGNGPPRTDDDNVVDPAFTRIGIGFAVKGGRLYATFEFSP